MTKQQLLHASKLFMELSDLFKVASEQQEVEAPVVDVIQPLVEVVEGEVVETPEVEADEEQIEDLSSMTIQQLRSLAKSHGLSTKGTKKDLIARINELNEPVEEEIVEDEVEETIEEVTPEVVEDEVEETVEDLEDEEEEIEESTEDMNEMELIQSELEAMEVDELVEILESVELPTKGKKQALISRILEAVADGLLEFFESDEIEEYDADEEDVELDEAIEQALEGDDTPEEEYEEVEVDEEDEYEDEEEELSPREATQQEIEEEIAEAYENGDLTDKEIANFLDDYFNGKFKPINKKRAYNKYVEIMCDLVDADGDRMDMQEAYYINDDEIYCCGSEIKELDNGNLFCEVCGTEYETE